MYGLGIAGKAGAKQAIRGILAVSDLKPVRSPGFVDTAVGSRSKHGSFWYSHHCGLQSLHDSARAVRRRSALKQLRVASVEEIDRLFIDERRVEVLYDSTAKEY